LLGHGDRNLTVRHYVDLGVDVLRQPVDEVAVSHEPHAPRLVCAADVKATA